MKYFGPEQAGWLGWLACCAQPWLGLAWTVFSHYTLITIAAIALDLDLLAVPLLYSHCPSRCQGA